MRPLAPVMMTRMTERYARAGRCVVADRTFPV
jgi:hypothetical protein